MTANTLLADGVRCGCEESDQPLPPHPFVLDYASNLQREIEAVDSTPPLVRVARLGNVALVTFLLEHGANANIAYHDLDGRHEGYENRYSKIPSNFCCGSVVQLVMQLGHPEIVQLLIDADAAINIHTEYGLCQSSLCRPTYVSRYRGLCRSR